MNKTLIIAEAGVNHNGDIELAKKLIDEAATAGADYVKFQTFKANKIVSPNTKKAYYQLKNLSEEDNSQYKMLKKLELSDTSHKELISHCKEKKIKFFSTAFDIDGISYLYSLKFDFFKIPSGELTNYPYLKAIAKTKKPVILSTGMANLDEIRVAIDVLITNGTKKEQLTNWERPKFNSSQCLYAATDAWICLEMYNFLERQKLLPGKIFWEMPVKKKTRYEKDLLKNSKQKGR